MNSNQAKLYRIISEVFDADIREISGDSSPDSIENWDSLRMVNLISELEQEFGLQFDILEIAEFYNVDIIQSTLIEKDILFK
jgi:acyl carrier protein